MKFLFALLPFVTIANSTFAAVFTNTADADDFVRSNSPTANYGGAGALSVSGDSSTNTASGLTNGIADTFIRFNTTAMVTNLNSRFGTNNWVVTGAKLQLTEVATPIHPIFDQGQGAFAVFWIANDDWSEGTGTPNAPMTDGIAYNDEPVLLTNTAILGTFTNTGTDATLLLPLTLPAAFAGDTQAGGEVGFYLTAVDPNTGFTFYSRSFLTASLHPFLEISAAPLPGISAISLSGTNIVLLATNGAAGGTYYVLSSTNLLLPFDQWQPVATTALSADGDFTITVTNAVNAGAPSQQFFILQTQ